MYPDNAIGKLSAAASLGGNYPIPQSQDAPQGISSAIAELAMEINENILRVDNLRSILGISRLQDPSGKTQEPTAFLEVIRQLTYRLRAANGDLGDLLAHFKN